MKVIYVEAKDTHAYLALCDRAGTTPKDCENIANIYKVKRKYQDALNWVEKGLVKKHGMAAAKIYSALGMRILKKGKSKYYQYALEHFQKVRKFYKKAGRDQRWLDIVERVRRNHSRKYSFIPDFEKIVTGRPLKKPESFKTRALKRWKKQIS